MISVIIINKNDQGIANTLDALGKQKIATPFEIIVVDASDAGLMDGIKKRHPSVRWFIYKAGIGSKKTTIPEQRNIGLGEAVGDIIVFIDANCVPKNDWLDKLTAPIIAGEENITAGAVRAANPKTRVNLNSETFKGDYLEAAPTISLALSKKVTVKIGKFDENLLYAEDLDYTWRCRDAGYKIKFIRNAILTHEWGTFRDEVRRAFKYGDARVAIFKKYPERRYKDLFGESAAIPVYTLYIVGLPLTIIFWWYPLLIIIPMIKNINQKPIKSVFLSIVYMLGFWWGLI